VFIEAVLHDREIEIHGSGQQTRSFTFVADTVRGVVAAVDSASAVGEVINIGSTEEVTILGLAQRVKALSGTPGDLRLRYIPYESFGGQYEDVQRRVPDPEKAERLLGFRAETGLDDGLSLTIEWQRSVQPAEAATS
jgi:UDP-glucose 4-epimerase